MMKKHWFLLAVYAFGLLSCEPLSSSYEIEMPLFLSGTEMDGQLFTADGWEIELDEAKLAFGPLYLCSGFQAGQYCEKAMAEYLGSYVIDLMSSEPREAGQIQGQSGTVHSWMLDYGLSSILTQREPLVLDAAKTLGGNSLSLRGWAKKDAARFPFSIAFPIQQTESTERGSSVARKSANVNFSHELTGDDLGLYIRFDASTWFSELKFSEFLEEKRCEERGSESTCWEGQALLCKDGAVSEVLGNCEAEGKVCVIGKGCLDEWEPPGAGQAVRALRLRLVAGNAPVFEWRGF